MEKKTKHFKQLLELMDSYCIDYIYGRRILWTVDLEIVENAKGEFTILDKSFNEKTSRPLQDIFSLIHKRWTADKNDI